MADPQSCDLLISGGSVVDGAGSPPVAADVAVTGGRIAAVGALSGWSARETVSAAGQVVAPGFIDAHTHDDRLVLSDPDMTPKISQGVTTVITGNCGVSLAPYVGAPPAPMNLLGDADWYRFPSFATYAAAVDDAPPACNLAMLCGHSALRACTMDNLDRAATASEIAEMGALLDEAMAAGAIGLSTGLAYPPAINAPTDEVVALAERLAPHGGIYATHMRNEKAGVVRSVEETIEIGRRAGVEVVISHHKATGRPNWGLTRKTLPLIERARHGQEVNLDVYPYIASSTVLLADWAPGAERVLITWSKPHPEHNGRDLAEVMREWGLGLEETVARLLPAGAIYFQMDEEDLQRVMSFKDAMIGSDGLPHDEVPHPRLWGTFPRVLAHYCRDLKLFPLEIAVHRMTGVPARVFGIEDRGEIRPGAVADLVMFDPEAIADVATFADPKRTAPGISLVYVRGIPVWRDRAWTGARPGALLRRAAGRGQGRLKDR